MSNLENPSPTPSEHSTPSTGLNLVGLLNEVKSINFKDKSVASNLKVAGAATLGLSAVALVAYGLRGSGAVAVAETAERTMAGMEESAATAKTGTELAAAGNRAADSALKLDPEIALLQHRQSFPALSNKAFFNFGTRGPMPQQALDELDKSYRRIQLDGPTSSAVSDYITDEWKLTKESLASHLGVSPDTIALTESTTEGTNIAMWGVDWKAGDNLLLGDAEHSSIIASAKQIASRYGVNLTFAPLKNAPAEQIPAILKASMQPNTKLVVASHVFWNTGQVAPIEKMADVVHANGARFLVDGAQSAGVLPLDLAKSNVDFYALPGHKWLSGPEGVSALYVKQSEIGSLNPTFAGWRGITEDAQGMPTGFLNTAQKFESATLPNPLLAALRKSIEVQDSFATPTQRYESIVAKATRLRDGLSKIEGVTVNTANAQESSLVTFSLDGIKSSDAVKWLGQQNYFTREVPGYVRASVHYLNTNREIDGLVSKIGELAHSHIVQATPAA